MSFLNSSNPMNVIIMAWITACYLFGILFVTLCFFYKAVKLKLGLFILATSFITIPSILIKYKYRKKKMEDCIGYAFYFMVWLLMLSYFFEYEFLLGATYACFAVLAYKVIIHLLSSTFDKEHKDVLK